MAVCHDEPRNPMIRATGRTSTAHGDGGESSASPAQSRVLIYALAGLALAGCGSASEPTPVPTTITAAVSPPAASAVGSTVSPTPAVRVNDQSGKPLAGVTVAFAVTGGGTIGSLTGLTDANGIASPVLWTLGTSSGPNTLTASVGTDRKSVV